ncbi:DUF2156 domain-containing protein [Paeniglutamicibacter cryotolerans]|nr:DUF2156 domain-containing protein [Paeniglutamicibacter cryotolerans]
MLAGSRSGAVHWRRAPVTAILLAVYWATGILTHAVEGRSAVALRHHLMFSSAQPGGNWLALLQHLFWAGSFAGYVVGTVLLALVGYAVERRMGSLRYLVAVLVTQLVGAFSAVGFVLLIRGSMPDWSRVLAADARVGISVLVCGVAMAGTAGMQVLWRRRIRLGLLAFVLVTVFYGGSLGAVMRLGAVLAGLLIGVLLLGRAPRRFRLMISRREGRVLVAVVLMATAIGPVFAAMSPDAVGPLGVLRYLSTNILDVDPATLSYLCSHPADVNECAAAQLQQRAGLSAVFTAILPSILLVVLSDGLRRGRRFAWWGALVVQGGITALTVIYILGVVVPAWVPHTGLLEGLGDYDFTSYRQAKAVVMPLLVPAGVFIMLLATRRLFTVQAPPHTYLLLARKVVLSGAGISVVYLGAGWVLREGFSPVPGIAQLFASLPDRFLPVVYALDIGPDYVPQSVPAVILYEGVGIVFWTMTSIWLLSTFLRPGHAGHGGDRDRARGMLISGSGGHLSWMSTWDGNSYWFSPEGTGFVAYRVIAGVALTSADPVAPAAEMRSTVDGFIAHCGVNGWTPCFYSVTARVLEAASDYGWSHVKVAEETVLPLGSLVFAGKKFQDIRTALNKAEKAGIQAQWGSYMHQPLAVREQIHEISEEWVAEQEMPEMGFTLGGLAELADPEVRLLIALDRDGTLHGLTSWMPVYAQGEVTGWTLDFMRRRRDGFRPTMEFLIASAALGFQSQGYAFASLSGAPLASAVPVGEVSQGAPGRDVVLERLLEWLGDTLEPVYGFRSLLAFKAKFAPQYVPMYMLYPDSASLPAIGSAVTRAYLGEVSVGQSMGVLRKLMRRRERADSGA